MHRNEQKFYVEIMLTYEEIDMWELVDFYTPTKLGHIVSIDLLIKLDGIVKIWNSL